MTDEKIMEKVRKLLNLAERAGTEDEARNAREKATDLMLRYAIDEALLQQTGAKREEKIIFSDISVEGYTKAKLHLMHRVARGMGMKSLQYNNTRGSGWSTGRGQVYGYESDVEAFKVLFSSLMMQAATEADRAFADYKRNGGDEHGRAWKQSFLIGFASEVGSRLEAQRKKVVAETEVSAPGTAVAVINRDEMVESRFYELNPKLGKATLRHSSYAGQNSGKAAGQRANLGQTSVGGGRKAIGR
jgi:hypothetical protein